MISYVGPCVANVILVMCTIIYTQTSIYGWIIVEETVAGLTGAGMTEFAIQMSIITDEARDKDDVCCCM
jgi:hypothetical protein